MQLRCKLGSHMQCVQKHPCQQLSNQAVAAKAAAATGIVSIPAGLVALSKGNLVRGAAVGAVSALISKESDEQNA